MLTLDFMRKMKYISLLLAVFFLISCQPNYNIKNSHYGVDSLTQYCKKGIGIKANKS